MSTTALRARAQQILDGLVAHYPDARCELDAAESEDPWRLLVAVVLSAQCTDVAVNKATPLLFDNFPTVESFAQAAPLQVEPFIRSLGLFRGKAKNIVAAAQLIVTIHGGQVPRARAVLETLPGVGSKSAAVIVANCFGVPALAVDTHVGRIGRRLGLTQHTNPDRVEAELSALWPTERLLEAHHTLIWHGRRTCFARRPNCEACPVATLCPKIDVDAPAPVVAAKSTRPAKATAHPTAKPTAQPRATADRVQPAKPRRRAPAR